MIVGIVVIGVTCFGVVVTDVAVSVIITDAVVGVIVSDVVGVVVTDVVDGVVGVCGNVDIGVINSGGTKEGRRWQWW